MDYSRISASQIEQLWELQKAYKAEIEEDQPEEQDRFKLINAVEKG